MEIKRLDHQARGIGYLDDKITFVKNALPFEFVDIEVIEEKKKYNVAKVVKYKLKSEDRIKPICPYFNSCGGCDLMHLNEDNQIEFKINKVKEIFRKYLDLNITPKFIQKDILNYRNKLSLRIEDGKLGFYSKETNDLVEITYCYLAKESINEFLKDYQYLNLIDAQVTVRCNNNDELLININTKDQNKINYEKLKSNHNLIGIIFNDKLVYGQDYFYETINDKIFKVSYNSFFQINNSITEEVFPIISSGIKKYSKILDLYCGVGTLGIAASLSAEKIYGIEIIKNAYKNALHNAKLNEIANAKYYHGPTEKIIKGIKDDFDVIIVDPPRKGLEQKDLDFLLIANPEELIYMSCDPMTLVRDLKILFEKYELNKVYALDMFAQTSHVESIVVLKRK